MTNKQYYINKNKKINTKLVKKMIRELEDWRWEMAYFTDEKIPTPKGVSKFIKRIMENICSKEYHY